MHALQKAARNQSFTPVAGGVLQRKCACGAGKKCEKCDEEPLLIQRAARNSERATGNSEGIPPIVHEVLRSPGEPLDTATRAFFEPRFGHDFAQVRVHSDARGAESARAVNALAYTVGREIVFADGRFSPRTDEGRRLLAHELTHTIQQSQGVTASLASQHSDDGSLPVSQIDDASEREADQVASAVMNESQFEALVGGAGVSRSLMLQRQPAAAAPAPAAAPPRAILARGTNPASCITPLCEKIAQQPPPATDAEAQQRSNDWATQTLDCVRSGAPASNASHAADIVANEESEVRDEATRLNAGPTTQAQGSTAAPPFQDRLRDTCRRKEREIRLEFHYNVLFESPVDGLQWGADRAGWDAVEAALSGLPVEATWLNGRLLRFRREACHPDDVDPNTQQCTGQSQGPGVTGFTGGEADPMVGRVQVFEHGLGAAPFSRSASLGLPATTQTLQHEVGHIIDSQLSQAAKEEFFDTIMHWHEYSWFWVNTPPASNPNAVAERARLRAETGLDEAALTAWLRGLPQNTPVVLGTRTYQRMAPSGADRFLLSFESAQMPAGKEFEYAKTNQGEYLAELYALAISRPEFLHTTLPAAQLTWLKRSLFHIPENIQALAQQTSLPPALQAELVTRGSRLFTWEQLDALMEELTNRAAQPAGAQPPPAGTSGQGTTGQATTPQATGQATTPTTTQPAATTAPQQRPSLRDIYHAQVRDRALEPLRKADGIRFLNLLYSLNEVDRHALEVDEPFLGEVRKIFHGLSLWTIRLVLKFGERRPDYTRQLYLAVSDRSFNTIKFLLHSRIELRDESLVPGVREMLNYELRDVPARADIMSDLSVSEEGRRAADEFARVTISVVKDQLLGDLRRRDGPSFTSHLNALSQDDRVLLNTDDSFLRELRKNLSGQALWIVRLRLRFVLGQPEPESVRRLSMAVSERNVQFIKQLLQQNRELLDETQVPGVSEMLRYEFRDHPQRSEIMPLLSPGARP